jgi:zinc/manganese transport system substrate-binding protein
MHRFDCLARRVAGALALAVAAAIATGAGEAAAAVRVVASLNDLASIAASVGGDDVEVSSICRASANPHQVEVLPSYMVRVSRARIYLKVGLGLDPWADQIVDGSHNADVLVVDCSKGVPVLDVPTGKVDASMGDVHPFGNPHYWLDPRSGAIVARTIAEALARVDPAHAGDYSARADAFAAAAEAEAGRAAQVGAALPSREIVTYHRSWSYLAHAMGLEVAITVEPVPGIPPTGRHLGDVVSLIRERRVAVLLEEPYFSEEASEFLARETGVRVVRASATCDDVSAGSYLAHFARLLEILRATAAPGGAGSGPSGAGAGRM